MTPGDREGQSLPISQAVQDSYPQSLAVCHGCGRENARSLGIRTMWDGREGLCHFTPRAWHTAYPGFVYGGLLASLIDCHSIGTAVAAMYAAKGRAPGSAPAISCVTASLQVDYLRPTPLGPRLMLRARIEELGARKAVVRCRLFADDEETVRGRVVAVRAPAEMF